MSFNAKTAPGGGPRTPPLERGLYPARLVQLVNLGLQPRSYKGEDKEAMIELMLTYELCDEFLVDEDGEPDPGKPRWVSESFPLYNLGAEKAKSTERYKVLDPTGSADGDFSKLLGTPVMLNIVQNPSKKDPTKIYAKISGLAPVRAKDLEKLPELVNSPRLFDATDPDMEVWATLPDWVQTRIKENLEFAGSKLAASLGVAAAPKAEESEETDDQPF